MTYLLTKAYSSRLNCPFTALDSAHPARDVFFFSAEEIDQQPVPLKNDLKLFKTGGTTMICRESQENHRNKSSSRRYRIFNKTIRTGPTEPYQRPASTIRYLQPWYATNLPKKNST